MAVKYGTHKKVQSKPLNLFDVARKERQARDFAATKDAKREAEHEALLASIDVEIRQKIAKLRVVTLVIDKGLENSHKWEGSKVTVKYAHVLKLVKNALIGTKIRWQPQGDAIIFATVNE